ncbi:hypothetical protein N8T08_006786 [Aspergillus melleus]|uniref:Uncharacterized protein n=1 Tax=Aspergillus melleus TaxID=138277 RepID=A0ACC3AZ54_9EURO|nr:hypothetical protein N8T08_006786 [Aspergillus melleus]
MTGVPYSTGCSLCLARRVKCDEATPSCTQCLKYGRPCPGYTRTFRFQDEGPRLERRHALSAAPITTTSSSSPRKRDITTLNPASGAAAAADVRGHALALMHREDVHAQQMQPHGPSNAASFYCKSGLDAFLCHDMQATLPITDINTLLRTIFHTHYHHNLLRLPHEPETRRLSNNIANSPFQDASTACLISIYQAQISNDPTQLETSRELYAQAIREVVSGLYGDAALSVDMLSATMNLALVAGVTMPDRGPGLLLQGVESAVALLDKLLARRHSDGRFRPFRLVCALNEGPAAMPPIEGITWLDQLASSFGMIGVKVADCQ